MEITFLGTAAATSYPLVFCQCSFCMKASKQGAKNLRKRSSVIINDDLLIDFGPDVVASSFEYNKPLTKIKYWLQTHPHSDHFDASHLSTRIPEYLGINIPYLALYASLKTIKRMSKMMQAEGYIKDLMDSKEQTRLNLSVSPVKPGESWNMGNYRVTALATNHDSSVESLMYAVSDGKTMVLYATDTDTLPKKTWEEAVRQGLKFDLVILDHTYGFDADSGDHLNGNRFVEEIKAMRDYNLLSPKARILATHISHEGNPPHEEMSKVAKLNSYEVAYDGLRLKV